MYKSIQNVLDLICFKQKKNKDEDSAFDIPDMDSDEAKLAG